ncbi:MAG TPA: ABC transporter permease [Steroidobacteraceae bacterium]|nr:ABC transporter permease [Steroidobacteraceae bacterium]
MVISIGFAVGATTAAYSTSRAIMRPPPGVGNLERIHNIYSGGVAKAISWPDYRDFRAEQTAFAAVTAWHAFSVALATSDRATTAMAEVVDGSYFEVLGIGVTRGRLLQRADDRPGAAPVAVISHTLWDRLCGGSPDAVGASLLIDGQSFTIVGIAHQKFNGLRDNGLTWTAVWIPLAAASTVARPGNLMTFDADDTTRRWLMVKGLATEGTSAVELAAAVTRFSEALDVRRPLERTRAGATVTRSWVVKPMISVRFENQASVVDVLVGLLLGTVCLVLLVACLNVAHLNLARELARRDEVTVQYSLGASRWRVLRPMLAENVLLGVGAWLLAIGVARSIANTLAGDQPLAGAGQTFHFEPRLDAASMTIASAAIAAALLIAGMGPAIIGIRARRERAQGVTGGRATLGWRGARYLIVGQVASSIVLLSVASLSVKEIGRAAGHDPGLDVDRLAIARVDFGSQGYDEARAREILENVRTALMTRTDIDAVAWSSGVPALTPVRTVGIDAQQGRRKGHAVIVAGTSNLLRTIGVDLLRGGSWNDDAAAGPVNVAIVSERTAKSFFGATEPLGQGIRVISAEQAEDELTVIGVATDTDVDALGRRDGAVIYVPLPRQPTTDAPWVLVVRAVADPGTLVPAMRDAFASVEPRLALGQVRTARDLISSSSLLFLVVATMASVLGAFAWMLSLTGLYGLLSQMVIHRTREIGLRLALGATRWQVAVMVVRQGLTPTCLGIGTGLLASVVARQALQPLLQHLIPAFDLVTIMLVPIVFVTMATCAFWLPARSAAGVEPSVTLRCP